MHTKCFMGYGIAISRELTSDSSIDPYEAAKRHNCLIDWIESEDMYVIILRETYEESYDQSIQQIEYPEEPSKERISDLAACAYDIVGNDKYALGLSWLLCNYRM